MKAKLIIVTLFISMSFIACKKESATVPNPNIQKLIGKWNTVSEVTNDYYSGASHITTYNFPAGDYSEFKIGGKFYSYSSGSTFDADYGFINASNIWIGFTNNLREIKILTSTDLQLYQKTISGADYTEVTTNFKK